MEPAPLHGGALARVDPPAQAVVDPVATPDDLQPDTILDAPAGLGPQVLAEEPHEHRHLRRRSAPVVGGEGVEGQYADAELGRSLDDPADHSRSLAVPRGARVPAAEGPSAVAV